ncbi:MAG: hypothetical protein M1838_005488 [Thelocarpon superellum]|nr:MAG: hypothetical protein M1838_005488 [Thelocarpon superellum]
MLTFVFRYLICLTIGPAFLSASIYLCLARIVVVFGEHISRFRPATYTIFFVGCDFISLLLQAIGGGIAATANPDDNTKDELGIHIMIAGLSFQVASLFVFIVLCSEFALRVYQRRSEISSSGMPLVRSLRFKGFLFALAAATLFIFIRSCFRVAELNGGFHGTLANQEVTFMLLEGMMIVLAVLSLTAFHPGLAFGEHWHAANFTLRKKTEAVFDEEKTGDQMASGST